MSSGISRREFVGAGLKMGTLAGLGGLELFHPLQGLFADPSGSGGSSKVALGSDIEPLARLLEETPRDRLFDLVAAKVRGGLGPAPLWTATLLAGVRSIKPRPVGYKFHAVMMVNSAAIASREVGNADRWIPLFWNMDYFKDSQAKDIAEGGWVMGEVPGGEIPSAGRAKALFQEAMNGWEVEKADYAIAGLYRTTGAAEIAELFWRYGARDFRDIGHKAIYVANSWRILETLGWRHAEPVLRSLAFALLAHEESGSPAEGDAEPDLPWRENLKRAGEIRAGWQEGEASTEATHDLWETLREGSWSEACERSAALLNEEVAPESLWDAFHLRAGELLMQQPGIVGVHCVDTTNALRYAYESSASDETRRMLLLQEAAFLVMFRQQMEEKGGLEKDLKLDRLERLSPSQKGEEAVREIFTDLATDRLRAARKTLAWMDDAENRPAAWMQAGRRLVIDKTTDAHDYKFSSAAFEDCYKVTPAWRSRFLASAAYNLKSTSAPDSAVALRARAALLG